MTDYRAWVDQRIVDDPMFRHTHIGSLVERGLLYIILEADGQEPIKERITFLDLTPILEYVSAYRDKTPWWAR